MFWAFIFNIHSLLPLTYCFIGIFHHAGNVMSTLPRMVGEHWLWFFGGVRRRVKMPSWHSPNSTTVIGSRVSEKLYLASKDSTQINYSNGHMAWAICHLNDALTNCPSSLSHCWTHMSIFISTVPLFRRATYVSFWVLFFINQWWYLQPTWLLYKYFSGFLWYLIYLLIALVSRGPKMSGTPRKGI